MKAWLARIGDDVKRGENIDLYLAVLAAVVLVGLNVVGVGAWTTTWVITMNLAVLALIAVSLLGNRHRLERIEEKLDQSPDKVFLQKYPDSVWADVVRAKTLWLVGQHLTTTTAGHRLELYEMLQRGAEINLIVVNPHSEANQVAMQRLRNYNNSLHHQRTLLNTLDLMSEMRLEFGRRLDIRTSDHVPMFGFYGVDIDSPNGVIYVETYSYKLKAGDVPRFVLRPHDGAAYEWFKEHMMNWWNDGKPWVQSNSELTGSADTHDTAAS